MADRSIVPVRWHALGSLGGRTVLWLALVVVLIAAADRTHRSWDFSADHRYSLTPALARLLHQHGRGIEIVAIRDSAGAINTIEGQLTAMSMLSPSIPVLQIDPLMQKPLLEDFASKHHGARESGIYVCRGDRIQALPLDSLSRLVLQQEVGGALLALSDPQDPVAVILQGMGTLRPGAGGADGCDALLSSLRLMGFTVRLQDDASVVPADALLILPGPTSPACSPGVVELINHHLHDGGSLIASLDDRAPSDLCVSLRMHGILVATGFPQTMTDGDWSRFLDPKAPTLPGMVVHSRHHHYEGPESDFPYARLLLGNDGDSVMINPTHPITTGIASSGQKLLSPRTSEVLALVSETLIRQESEIGHKFADSGNSPLTADCLLSTSSGDVWAQKFSQSITLPQGLKDASPRCLAWAVTYPPQIDSVRDRHPARIVIWGSREALSDAVMPQEAFANAELFRAMAGWSSGREPPRDIPPSRYLQYQTTLGDRGIWWVLALLVIALPLTWIGGAMLMWWDRR